MEISIYMLKCKIKDTFKGKIVFKTPHSQTKLPLFMSCQPIRHIGVTVYCLTFYSVPTRWIIRKNVGKFKFAFSTFANARNSVPGKGKVLI